MEETKKLVQPNWSEIKLEGDPTLFIGWRRWNNRLEAQRVSLHKDVQSSLLALCQKSISNLGSMTAVDYGPYAHPEYGEEYFCIDLKEVDTAPDVSDNGDAAQPKATSEGADLLKLGSKLENLDFISAAEIKNRAYSFYGISWKVGEERYTFIRKSNPKKSLGGGVRFFKFAETLKNVEKPDLVLEDEFDIVVTNTLAVVMQPGSFQVLTADVKFATKHVSEHVKDLGVAFESKVPISESSQNALEKVAKKKTTVARRLLNVLSVVDSVPLSAASLRNTLDSHGIDPKDLLDDGDNFVFDVEQVDVFLDIIEGRYFEQDFTGLRARADRFRPR